MSVVQKIALCREIQLLSKPDLIDIMRILKKHNESIINIYPDGSRVDLSLLSDSVVESLYNVLKYKLNLK